MHNRFPALSLMLFLIAAPAGAGAASVFLSLPESVAPGAEVRAEVRADLSTVDVNTIEGSVLIPAAWDMHSIDTAGSALALWPVPPRFEYGERRVSFTGGTPGGIPRTDSALLFTLVLSPQEESAGGISVSAVGYLNDGAGTRVALASGPSATAPAARAAERDSDPPETIATDIGSDPSLFEGRLFLTVVAGDRGSGVAKVEVKEGRFSPWKEVGQYYVLDDQERTARIQVRVTDGAGNASIRTIEPERSAFSWLPLLLILAAALAALGMRMFRTRRV